MNLSTVARAGVTKGLPTRRDSRGVTPNDYTPARVPARPCARVLSDQALGHPSRMPSHDGCAYPTPAAPCRPDRRWCGDEATRPGHRSVPLSSIVGLCDSTN